MSNEGRGNGQDALVDASAGDVLTFAEACHADRLQAERNILRAAYQWAILHSPDRLPATDRRSRERAKPAGAEGTPLITEYAAATFGARIQTSPYGARKLIADAVDLHQRLPRLNAGISAGTVRVGHARHVAEATRELSPEEAAWVDAEVAEVADGRIGWKRFEALVEGKVAAASPELAQVKEETAAKDRYVRMSRVNRHGIATLTIRDHAATILTAEAALTFVAKTLKDKLPGHGLNERRLAAAALMLNPEARPDVEVGPAKPKVQIYLHLTPDSPIARMEDHGPVTRTWVRDLVAHVAGKVAGKVKVTPVIDLNRQISADAYEIPSRLREAVRLIHPADVFPYATNTGRRMDLDHQIPYADGGPTSTTNLGPLTRTHHRIKTHAGWKARQPFPGIIVWRDPYGAHYIVDNTGTRKIPSPGDPPHAA